MGLAVIPGEKRGARDFHPAPTAQPGGPPTGDASVYLHDMWSRHFQQTGLVQQEDRMATGEKETGNQFLSH